jgi:hypothetical protein
VLTYPIDSYDLRGLKSQVSPVFGQDVFEAIRKATKWNEDSANDRTTGCVNCKVIPGQVIVVDLFLEYNECIAFINGSF